MGWAQNDGFAVFVRDDEDFAEIARAEHEVVRCFSYEEAREEARQLGQRASEPRRHYIIRFVGAAGGGD